MRHRMIIAGLVLGLSALALAQSDRMATTRSLSGQIKDSAEAPLPKAVVYLKNTKTLAVRTFIADDKGDYRFHSLAPNIDYEVYAEYNGKKSDTKTLSSFDSRSEAYINLKIDIRR